MTQAQSTNQPIRTLVLSGGGGRGAFHAGVYKYLMESGKVGLPDDVSGPWVPDVVLGTSIGAVNGAAIAQGISATALEQFWLSLRAQDVEGLPPGMGWLARRVANLLLRAAIGSPLPQVTQHAMSPPASESWPPLPILPRGLSTRLIGRWSNLLDTGPLYQTLGERLGINEAAIAESEKILLIAATDVRSGEGVVFSNREVINPRSGLTYDYCRPGITRRRIIASCSIPMVYPWTQDEDGATYWDGAVVINTPLGPAFDAVRDVDPLRPMEVVVVMMTPWWEHSEDAKRGRLPQDFGEAITWTLDWALLASFRSDLKLARAFSDMAADDITAGRTPRFRRVDDIIVAPEHFLPATRIIDYDEDASRALIAAGYEAAQTAFARKYAAG